MKVPEISLILMAFLRMISSRCEKDADSFGLSGTSGNRLYVPPGDLAVTMWKP
jgi:hypothetical protein